MATLANVSVFGICPVDDGVSGPQARGVTACGPTGPELLGEAAVVLPEVVGRGPVRCADVHTALQRAAGVLGMGRDRPHRLRLADEALDLLAAYLAGGRCAPTDTSRIIRAWFTGADLVSARMLLAAAAGYWRRMLARS